MYTVIMQKNMSPCSFKRKQAFILLSSKPWGEFLLCMCTHSFAYANDTKSVCSRDAQCTEELP